MIKAITIYIGFLAAIGLSDKTVPVKLETGSSAFLQLPCFDMTPGTTLIYAKRGNKTCAEVRKVISNMNGTMILVVEYIDQEQPSAKTTNTQTFILRDSTWYLIGAEYHMNVGGMEMANSTTYEDPYPVCGLVPTQGTFRSLTTTMGFGGEQALAKAVSTYSMKYIGREEITVPVGRFSVTVVEMLTKLSTSDGLEIRRKVYYAEGIGMVCEKIKTISNANGTMVVTETENELIAYDDRNDK